jgi:hypothetical protein
MAMEESSLQEISSYLLNWNPVWLMSFGAISGERLKIFKNFQLKYFLAEKLQYVYLLIAILSFIFLLVNITYGEIFGRTPVSWYILGLSIGNLVYHTVLFVLFKVQALKKKTLKMTKLLNGFSLILLHLFFIFNGSVLSLRNSLTTVTAGLIVTIFEDSVVLVYFQDSYFLSLCLWIVVTSLGCSGVLGTARSHTADFAAVVSILCPG